MTALEKQLARIEAKLDRLLKTTVSTDTTGNPVIDILATQGVDGLKNYCKSKVKEGKREQQNK